MIHAAAHIAVPVQIEGDFVGTAQKVIRQFRLGLIHDMISFVYFGLMIDDEFRRGAASRLPVDHI